LKVIPQQEFQKCFQQWQHRWAKCIAAEGEYFEGKPSADMLALKSLRELIVTPRIYRVHILFVLFSFADNILGI